MHELLGSEAFQLRIPISSGIQWLGLNRDAADPRNGDGDVH